MCTGSCPYHEKRAVQSKTTRLCSSITVISLCSDPSEIPLSTSLNLKQYNWSYTLLVKQNSPIPERVVLCTNHRSVYRTLCLRALFVKQNSPILERGILRTNHRSVYRVLWLRALLVKKNSPILERGILRTNHRSVYGVLWLRALFDKQNNPIPEPTSLFIESFDCGLYLISKIIPFWNPQVCL